MVVAAVGGGCPGSGNSGNEQPAPLTHAITGTISGPWVEGVGIALTGASTAVATTNAAGQYSFTGLADGSYVVTPILSGYQYAPAAASVTIGGASQVLNFEATPSMASYSLSGIVSYAGSKTGRVYVVARDAAGKAMGTSIAGPTGSYTIRGLGSGSYDVHAWMDILGHGVANASDPSGSASATIGAANVTGAGVTLADPATPTATVPTNVKAIPGNGFVLLRWDGAYVDGAESATSYEISWGDDANASNGGVIAVDARDDASYFHAPLTDGATIYYKVRSRVGTAPSTYSSPVSVTVGAAAGGNTVSGTVSFPGTATGPLYVAVVDETDKVNGEVRIVRYPAPTSPVTYSVSGVGTGERWVYAILDQDADGVIDEGDLRNFNDAIPFVVSGNATRGATLDGAGALAVTSTEHVLYTGGTQSYMIINIVMPAAKVATSVTMFSGSHMAVPADLAYRWNYQIGANLGTTPPAVGDAFKFKVQYSDGSSEILSSATTALLVGAPQNLAVNTATPYSSAVPQLTWSDPPSTAGLQGFRVDMAGWHYPDARFPMPATTHAVVYNVDGRAYLSSLGSGTYDWSVSAEDVNGNRTTKLANYVVP